MREKEMWGCGGRQSRLKDESCGNSVIRCCERGFFAYLGLGGMLVWFCGVRRNLAGVKALKQIQGVKGICENVPVNDSYGVNFKDTGVGGMLVLPSILQCLKSPLMSLGMP